MNEIGENYLKENEDKLTKTKFCKFCGKKIHEDAVVCTFCGRQVEILQNNFQPQVIVNNSNANSNSNSNSNSNANTNIDAHGMAYIVGPRDKWIAFFLCLFTICGHKFYERNFVMGFVYLFTGGLLGIGWFIDLVILLFKPNPYYLYL